MEGVRLGGPGFSPAGVDGAPKFFDIFTENRPFRDLRVHENRQTEEEVRNWERHRACTLGHTVRRIHTRSAVYTVHGRAKVQNCIGQKRMRCFQAARARDERFTQR